MSLNKTLNLSSILHWRFSLQYLYYQYPLASLSFSDLYTYEIIILLVYGVMLAFSFFTNSIAIVVFLFGRRSRTELTPYLLNLSVFNIIMTVYCIPFTITSIIFQRWLYGRALCGVLDSFKTFSVSGVLLTLITIAVDRYWVIKYPLVAKVYSPKRRGTIAIVTIWILSISLALIWSPTRSLPMNEKRLWVSSRALLYDYLNALESMSSLSKPKQYLERIRYKIIDTVQCVPNRRARQVELQRAIFNCLQTYFIPLFILAFVYLRIAVMLWRRKNDVNYDAKQGQTRILFTNESIQFKKKLKNGVKMLVAVVVLYAVLWLPMNMFQLIFSTMCYPQKKYPTFCTHPLLAKLFYIAAHLLTVSNTAINPIIYGFMNRRFRNDIQQLMSRCVRCEIRTSVQLQKNWTGKTPQRPASRNLCGKNDVPVTQKTDQRIHIEVHLKKPASLSDHRKLHQDKCASGTVDKDRSTVKTRHTN